MSEIERNFLEIVDLKKGFGSGETRQEVLRGMDFSVAKGEFCVLLGPSGSGKSTLLNIIGGIDSADSGYISINGDKLEEMGEKKLTQYRRKHLGYVFQMYNLIGNLNVKENIEVGAYLSDNPLDIDELLHTLGLYDHRYKLPNQLSGGQQQRVSIGRAIVKNPDILLCDEPTGALDYNTSKEILKLIEDVNQKYGNTIIMVTHNEAIRYMADHVIMLRDGMVRHNDINNEVYISEPFRDKYNLEEGDTVLLDEKYENKQYQFKIVGIYDKCQSIAIFMSNESFQSVFNLEEEEFTGYLSDSEIADIEEENIATVITERDITKMCDQLDHSMGAYMDYFQILCILLSAVLIYLLTKIIIEKNENAISMTKILGYENREIASLYLISTTVILLIEDIVSVGLGALVMAQTWRTIMFSYSGWFEFMIKPEGYVKMFFFVLIGYAILSIC